MSRWAKVATLLFVAPLCFPQTPQPLQYTNITNAFGVIDNRSITRQNDYHSFCAFGTGAWTAQLQYSDISNTGPWTNFLGASLVTNNSAACIGAGYGFHSWIQIATTGTVNTLTYSGSIGLFFVVSGTGNGTVTNLSGNLTLDQPVFGNGAGDIKVGTKTGSTDVAVMQTNPTIIQPTIADFTFAQHNHSNAAGGGNIPFTSITGIGTIVQTNQGNIYSTGIQNFGLASLILPSGGGLTPTAAGSIAFNSTLLNLSYGDGTLNHTIATRSGAFVNNHCVQVSISGSEIDFVDSGNACGVGSGGLADPGSNGIIKRTALNVTAPATFSDVISLFTGCSGTQYPGVDGNCHTVSGSVNFQTNAVGLTSSTTVNFQNSAAFNGLTATFSNPSAGNIQLGFSGTLANTGLTNSSLSYNGVTVALGAGGNIGQLNDTNGVPSVKTVTTASAVDQITVTPAAAANPATVGISATGTDSNININLIAKGTGVIQAGGVAIAVGAPAQNSLPVVTSASGQTTLGTSQITQDAGTSQVSSGLGFNAPACAVTFSATPTIDASQCNTFTMTLTGNTSPTFVNMKAGGWYVYQWTQDATGGRVVTLPGSFQNGNSSDPTPSVTTTQQCQFTNSQFLCQPASTTDTATIIKGPFRNAPAAPPSGNYYTWYDNTAKNFLGIDNASNISAMVHTLASQQAHKVVSFIDQTGTQQSVQLAFADISGTATGGQLPATVMQTNQTNTVTTGIQDFSASTAFRPKSGTTASIPATCTAGLDVYLANDATAGQNWYFCTSTNTWTQQLNSGAGSGVGNPYSQSFTCSTSATSIPASTHKQGVNPLWEIVDGSNTPLAFITPSAVTINSSGDLTFKCMTSESAVVYISGAKGPHPNWGESFSSTTSLAIPAMSNQIFNTFQRAQVYDTASPRNWIIPGSYNVDPNTFAGTLSFTLAQAGYVIVNTGP